MLNNFSSGSKKVAVLLLLTLFIGGLGVATENLEWDSLDPVNVTDTEATLRGGIENSSEYSDFDIKFRYREIGETEWIETDERNVDVLFDPSYYSEDVEGLSFDTEYEHQFGIRVPGVMADFSWSDSTEFTTTEEELEDVSFIAVPERIGGTFVEYDLGVEDMGGYDSADIYWE